MAHPGRSPPLRKLTTEDLFGDILSELEGAPPRPPAPAAPPPPPGPPAEEAPGVQTADLEPVLSAQEPAAPELPAPGPAPAAPEPPAAEPAGSAPTGPVLAEREEEPVLEQFGNYYLLEKIAVGGMAELFKARQRGVARLREDRRHQAHPAPPVGQRRVRQDVHRRGQARGPAEPPQHRADLRSGQGRATPTTSPWSTCDGKDLRRACCREVREYRPAHARSPGGLRRHAGVPGASTTPTASAASHDRELRLVHRDVSPQNILISYDGEVKLVDFGIAKAADQGTADAGGALKGKLLYMSPEQALGQPLDGRSDIYSLGLVLAELLTGERCFQADSELGVLEKVRLGKVLDPGAVNPDISPEMGGDPGPRPCRRTWTSAMPRPACWSGT